MKKLIPLVFLFLSLTSQSQDFLSWRFNDRYFSFTVGSGSSTYFGELNHSNKIHDGFSQVNVGVEARLLNKVGARLEATSFQLRGKDFNAPDSSFQKQRNLSFHSRNFQIQLHTIYYLKHYQGDYFRRWIFDPYLVTGVGFFSYDPKAELKGEVYSLRDAKTEGSNYGKWAVSIPAGIGAKFKINDFFNIQVEAIYNFTFNDYIDDVSGNYTSEPINTTAELLSNRKDEIGVVNETFYDQMVPGTRRGDSSNNDHFLMINLKAEFFLPPLFGSK